MHVNSMCQGQLLHDDRVLLLEMNILIAQLLENVKPSCLLP